MGRPTFAEFVWVDGGRDDDLAGEGAGGSMVMDLRRSAKEERRSLIRSLTIVMEDRRSFLTSFEGFDSRLSRMVSLGGDGGATIAF